MRRLPRLDFQIERVDTAGRDFDQDLAVGG